MIRQLIRKNPEWISDDELARHLRALASRFYPEIGHERVEVHIRRKRHRFDCTLYEFDLRSQNVRRQVLVKKFSEKKTLRKRVRQEYWLGDQPPQICPRTHDANHGYLEYAALSTIRELFESLNDPRFGTIRTLDVLPRYGAVVMEKKKEPTLERWFVKANRLQFVRSENDLISAFRHAGAWLRLFHQAPGLPHTDTRSDHVDDYVDSTSRLTRYLAQATGEQNLFNAVQRKLETTSKTSLPNALPVGTAHGDFTMGNILVGHGRRVTIIDTHARWRAPIYEDLARLSASMKTCGSRIYTLGRIYRAEVFTTCEEALWQGYFQRESVPVVAIRLFECQLLLERWASIVFRHQEATGLRRVAKGCRRALWQSWLRTLLLQIGDDLPSPIMHPRMGAITT